MDLDDALHAYEFPPLEAESTVQVRVTALTGNVVAEFELPSGAPVAAAKRRIFDIAGVPTTEQRLVSVSPRTAPLNDGCRMEELAAGAGGWIEINLIRVESHLALSWSADRTLVLWDLAAGAQVHDFGGHTSSSQLSGMLVDWEQGLGLSWGGDKTMRVWDVHRGAVLQNLGGHSSEVLGLQVDWERSRALSWAADHTLRLWDLLKGYVELRGHSAGIQGVHVGWERNRAMSWSDSDAVLWDLGHGSAIHVLQDLAHAQVSSVDEAWAGALIWNGNLKCVRFWDLQSNTLVPLHGITHDLPVGIQMDWAQRCGISASTSRGTLQLWDLQGSHVTEQVPGIVAVQADSKRARAVSWSIVNLRVLQPQLWDISHDPNAVMVRKRGAACDCGGTDVGLHVHVDWDHCRAVSWSAGCTLFRIWELENGTIVHELRGHNAQIDGAQVDWENNRMLSWSADETTLRLWDVTEGKQVHEMVREPCGAFGLQVDWDRSCVLTWTMESWGNYEFTIELWDFGSGTSYQVLNGHTDVMLGAAMSPQRRSYTGSSRARRLYVKDHAQTTRKEKAAAAMDGKADDEGWATDGERQLFTNYTTGELDNLIAEYREVLRAMPRGPPISMSCVPLDDHRQFRMSGEPTPYGPKYVPMEEANGRARFLMLGDAITMGAPWTNSSPFASAIAKMNAGVLVENAGWGGIFSMMALRPQDFEGEHGTLPLPTPGQYECDYACILIGTMDAIAIAGTDMVVEIMCSPNGSSNVPAKMPQDWKATHCLSIELYEENLRCIVRELVATGTVVTIATIPPLGEELEDTPPADKLVRDSPFRVVRELASAARRVAKSEGCEILPFFECCIHHLKQLSQNGRTLLPWKPKEFWDRMLYTLKVPDLGHVPWEDVFPENARPALCHDLVKLNESGAAIFASLVQTWLDAQLSTGNMAVGDDSLKERLRKVQAQISSASNLDTMNSWEHLVTFGTDAGIGDEVDEWSNEFLMEPWSPETREEPEPAPIDLPEELPNCAICNQTLGTYQGELFCWSCMCSAV